MWPMEMQEPQIGVSAVCEARSSRITLGTSKLYKDNPLSFGICNTSGRLVDSMAVGTEK